MEYSFRCNEKRTAYKNSGAAPQTVNIAIQENCGGNSRVTVFDSKHHVVGETVFRSPGGAVTLSVHPNQEVEIFCDGGTDPHGCKYEIVF
jgi:hypothetical protein